MSILVRQPLRRARRSLADLRSYPPRPASKTSRTSCVRNSTGTSAARSSRTTTDEREALSETNKAPALSGAFLFLLSNSSRGCLQFNLGIEEFLTGQDFLCQI